MLRVIGNLAIVFCMLLGGVSGASAQSATSQASSQPTPSHMQRLEDLLGLIEGQNPPEVRQTIARELLLQGWPETPGRVVRIFCGANAGAQVALANALAELPQYLHASYVEPLLELLGAEDGAVREAAARTLVGYSNGGVIEQLRGRALDAEASLAARRAALRTLGLMTKREAIEALTAALDAAHPAIVETALVALEQATAMNFGGDVSVAREWGAQMRALPLEEWQALQVERLVRETQALRARVEAAETRLVKVLESNFLRAADAERTTLLAAYLTDPSTAVRLLGLHLMQVHLAEGKTVESLGEATIARAHELMASSAPREQAAAVRAVASFRNPADAKQFVQMLNDARHRAVRLALINGLGYVGDGAATRALLKVLENADEESTTEAVAALGRLAERSAIHDEQQPQVVEALKRVFAETTPEQVALRERVIWAMGNLADPSFGSAFAAALDPAEGVAVRQAAARGITLLNDPQLADALIPATRDPDAGVRRTAIETLAELGARDVHLQALWERLDSPPESDEVIQQAAWRGVLAMLARKPAEELEVWLGQLPAEAPAARERTLDLLQRLAKVIGDADPVDRGRIGVVRARIAEQHARLDQPDAAIEMYITALSDLHAAQDEGLTPVAVALMELSLRHDRYDERVAQALGNDNPTVDANALWATAKAIIEPLIAAGKVDRAVAMLGALEAHPPGKWPGCVVEEMRGMATQARKSKTPTTAPTTQAARG